MSERNLWLRIRIVEPGRPIMPDPADVTGEYLQHYNVFMPHDYICEVMDGDEVVGVLPNFLSFAFKTGISDFRTNIDLTFLCTDNPFHEKEIRVR
jgi:hypothetical protein